MTKRKLAQVAAAVGLAGSFAIGTAVAKAPAPTAPEFILMKDLTWTPLMKEGPLPAMAPIHGDAMKGAYEGYLKLPAGFTSPPHSHSSEYWSVLVQGKMTHWAADGGSEKDAKPLGIGDVTHMPAKLVHFSKCYPGADCIIVTVQPGKSDFIPAKEKEAPKAAPAAAPAAPAAPAKK